MPRFHPPHRFLPLLLLIVLALLGTACAEDQTAVERAEEANIEPLVLGDEATITGEVTDVLGPFSFRLNDTLVVGATDQVVSIFEEFAEGEEVVATGTIREFIIADFEDEFGFDYDDELLSEFENQLALVASNVQPATEPGELEAEEGELLDEETADFQLGQQVTVIGETTEFISPFVFRLGDTLVVSAQDDVVTLFEENEELVVTGTVREFVIVDIEEELGIDLDDEALAEFETEQELAIVAQNVRAVP